MPGSRVVMVIPLYKTKQGYVQIPIHDFTNSCNRIRNSNPSLRPNSKNLLANRLINNMFPGLGSLNPKKMQGMMKQMGIQQDEIPAEKVTIDKTDGSKIIIQNPAVTKITMQGQESYQITGDAAEEAQGPTEEDIKLVAEKTNKSEAEAKQALEQTNDIAEAILQLSK